MPDKPHTWRIDTPLQTMVLAANQGCLPCVLYWGTALPSTENLDTLNRAAELDVTGGMIDENPDLSICPESSRTFSGQAGLSLRDENGQLLLPKFLYKDATHDGAILNIRYTDTLLGLQYSARFEAFADTGLISASATINADSPIYMQWFAAPVMPASAASDDMIDYSGRWCGEFQENRTPWNAGIRLRENPTGRTGHEHFPALIVPNRGTTYTAGSVYSFHYGYSGGHRMVAEQLPDGRRQIQFGHASNIEYESQKHFSTAPVYLGYSDHGLNGCARAYQRHVQQHIVTFPKPQMPRPVHYNCWEAVYFDHSLTELKDIASRTAALGAERFVLDDGWFGTRDDDTQALGDWTVDPRKYPEGLEPLIEHVQAEGMDFGIWFEPEMVNPNSELYRTHPNWILSTPDQILGRQQMVLNIALSEVQDYLFQQISDILKPNNIAYIKWDHNRVLPAPDANQTRGIYALLDRLRTAFPNVEIESCSSGGGRIDFGMLNRTQRVWLSDSNDAIERARIQHNAAMFLPAAITGSHVGPGICHTSGRVLDMPFRAWIAAQRHMGFEMNPRELTEDKAHILNKITQWWKSNRDWMMRADILRLDSDDPSVLAEQHLATDENQFVVFANKIDTSAQISPRPLRLTGLQAQKFYQITLINREDAPKLSRGHPLLKSQSLSASGQYLMSHGVTLPWSFPCSCWVLKGHIL